MGTRADFYVGRGENAEWLGSVGYDGYPDGIEPAILKATTEQEYRKVVAEFFSSIDYSTLPEQGWPWPWNDSHLTDYTYAFDGGVVYVSSFGRGWWDASDGIEKHFYDSWEAFDADMNKNGFSEDDIEECRKTAIIGDGNHRVPCAQCDYEHHLSVIHPNMKDIQQVTLEKRSGTIVFGCRK